MDDEDPVAVEEAPPATSNTKPPTARSLPEAFSDDQASVEVPYQLNVRDDPIQDTPTVSTFDDHFTLQIPSSVIRYRDKKSAARVIETSEAQFVLEETVSEDNVHHISIRRIHNTSTGVQVLRVVYATVTAFWTGFLFVFCLQILLFLFLDLALQTGATTKQSANWGQAVGAILAFPGFVYS